MDIRDKQFQEIIVLGKIDIQGIKENGFREIRLEILGGYQYGQC